MDDGHGLLPFLRERLPGAFELRRTVLAPGCAVNYDASEWRDALVVVEHGEFEIECLDGRRRRFGAEDALWLAGLPLRALRNPGQVPAVLVAVSRRRGAPDGGPSRAETAAEPEPPRTAHGTPRRGAPPGDGTPRNALPNKNAA